MNKENSEKVAVKVAVIFFISVPCFFLYNLKMHYKICNTQSNTLEKEIVEWQRLSGQNNTAVMEGKARSLGRRKLGKIFHIKIYSKFCCKVVKSSKCFEEIPVLRLILKLIISFCEHVL